MNAQAETLTCTNPFVLAVCKAMGETKDGVQKMADMVKEAASKDQLPKSHTLQTALDLMLLTKCHRIYKLMERAKVVNSTEPEDLNIDIDAIDAMMDNKENINKFLATCMVGLLKEYGGSSYVAKMSFVGMGAPYEFVKDVTNTSLLATFILTSYRTFLSSIVGFEEVSAMSNDEVDAAMSLPGRMDNYMADAFTYLFRTVYQERPEIFPAGLLTLFTDAEMLEQARSEGLLETSDFLG